MSEDEKFDVIVVGAGPAGAAAALVLARAGLEVAVLERGRYPGAKNTFGGILYTTILNSLIPEFWNEAPVERHVVRRKYSMLDATSEMVMMDIRSEDYSKPPYNNSFTVLRAKFDQWFAEQAEEAGAMVIPETLVDELIMKDGKVAGVNARGDELLADVIICAEGANGLLVKQAGLRKDYTTHDMGVGVKEIITLPQQVIDDRFGLEGDQGVGFEYMGASVAGMAGGGFLYTNRESISIGVVSPIDAYMKSGKQPNAVLENFKSHPCVRPLLRGGETVEVSAHMIPEGGYDAIPELITDGFLVVGDAAHFVNASMFHEGTNLAMASGVLAAETIIEAKEKGDFSKQGLAAYEKKLEESFIFKDLKKFRLFGKFVSQTPEFFDEYTELAVGALKDYFTISDKPKSEIQKAMWKRIRAQVKWIKLIKDMNRFRKAVM